jgi:hypothetical protein
MEPFFASAVSFPLQFIQILYYQLRRVVKQVGCVLIVEL